MADDPSRQATVVVPTFKRPDGLRRTLTALGRQESANAAWDVVVVDNGDGPDAERVVGELRGSLPVPITFTREARRGASHARNRGISLVRAPITVFLDDDVEPEKGWLAHLLDPILAGRADAVAGRVVLDPAAARPSWFDASWNDTPFGDFDRGVEECELAPDDYINTANGAVKTELLRAVGGFDPVLGPRDGVPLLNDDVRLYRDLRELGARVVYSPEAVVIHELPVSRLNRRYIIRREYFRGRSSWLSERERHAVMRTAGMGAAADKLRAEVRAAAGRGLWRAPTLYSIAADVAFAIGYGREAARCLLRGRRVEPSGAWLDEPRP